jgi:hypothetical protein
MAELKRMLSLRLQSSSLIEVTVSLIIISIIFSLSITIYLNVQRSGFSSSKLVYNVLLDDAYNGAIKAKDFSNKEFEYEDFTLFQIISSSGENENLKVLRFEVRNKKGQLLGERKYLLYVPS